MTLVIALPNYRRIFYNWDLTRGVLCTYRHLKAVVSLNFQYFNSDVDFYTHFKYNGARIPVYYKQSMVNGYNIIIYCINIVMETSFQQECNMVIYVE